MDESIYPEISAGKHRYSVRFMHSGTQDSIAGQVNRDIEFLLTLCAL
jgi:cell division protein ZapD